MSTVEITKDNFQQEVSKNDIAVLDFWAPWCGPCKRFGPIFEQVSEQHAEVTFGKINTDEQPELSQGAQVMSIPTTLIIKGGVVIHTQVGAMGRPELEKLVEWAQELDIDSVKEALNK